MDDKMIKKLKELKAAAISLRDVAHWTQGNSEFIDKVDRFVLSVPHFKKDFEGLDSNSIVREYSAIKIIADGLLRDYTLSLNNDTQISDADYDLYASDDVDDDTTLITVSDNKDIKNELKKDIVENKEKIETRGGKRKGAGRPSLGTQKRITMILSDSDWSAVDALIAEGIYESYADYFRTLSKKEIERTDIYA